jgi:hypothetical protein
MERTRALIALGVGGVLAVAAMWRWRRGRIKYSTIAFVLLPTAALHGYEREWFLALMTLAAGSVGVIIDIARGAFRRTPKS